MTYFFRIYSIAFLAFIAIDLAWLGLIAKNIYGKYLGYIMKPSPSWGVAILFYLVFVTGVVFFVVYPALEKASWRYALLTGIFFGFITYSTYDLTNLATLKDWPLLITIIDLIWGSVLGGTVSLITYFIASEFHWNG